MQMHVDLRWFIIPWSSLMWPKDYLDNFVMLHWFQSCSTDFSHAPLTSVMLHWFQSCSTDFSYKCSTDFSHAPLSSVMLHWFQSCSTDFSHAPPSSVMLHWFQSCSTDFSHAPLTSVMLHWFQSCSTDFIFQMKFCTLLWKKTATTQKIFCIAVMQTCIANCDAIPGKLFPVNYKKSA